MNDKEAAITDGGHHSKDLVNWDWFPERTFNETLNLGTTWLPLHSGSAHRPSVRRLPVFHTSSFSASVLDLLSSLSDWLGGELLVIYS